MMNSGQYDHEFDHYESSAARDKRERDAERCADGRNPMPDSRFAHVPLDMPMAQRLLAAISANPDAQYDYLRPRPRRSAA